MADEEDTRHAIAAVKNAIANFSGSTTEDRKKILRQLHQAATARVPGPAKPKRFSFAGGKV